MRTFFNLQQDPSDNSLGELIVSFRESGSSSNQMGHAVPSALGLEKRQERDPRLYSIRWANTQKQKKSARALIEKMYSRRNYKSVGLLEENSRLSTFLVYDGLDRLVGTVTVGLDSSEGLFAEEVYREEVNSIRKTRGKVCEFTGLAVLPDVRSKKVLGGLFHVAMIYASRIANHSGVIFEVTPMHGRIYEKMLGMNLVASGKICPRVNVESVLIHADFSFVEEQIQSVHLSAKQSGVEMFLSQSLYQHFFCSPEVSGILKRFDELLKKESTPSPSAFAPLSSSLLASGSLA